jgi:hypothetical protein
LSSDFLVLGCTWLIVFLLLLLHRHGCSFAIVVVVGMMHVAVAETTFFSPDNFYFFDSFCTSLSGWISTKLLAAVPPGFLVPTKSCHCQKYNDSMKKECNEDKSPWSAFLRI